MATNKSVADAQGQPDVWIRGVQIEDALAVARLTGELGYPAPLEAIQERIATLISLKDHVVYAACIGDRVLGWIDVRIVYHLQDEPCGEIGGLVVDSQFRSRGIGALLVAKCEQWTVERGVA